jgi:hypothetical protein
MPTSQKISLFFISFILLSSIEYRDETKLIYNRTPLLLKENTLTDSLGSFTAADLPSLTPKCSIGLKENATTMTNKMWKIALHEVEQNLVTNAYGTYFDAGRRYTDMVYTRDIAFAGILGLNFNYPQEMLQSLKVTRDVVSKMGYKVLSKHKIKK